MFLRALQLTEKTAGAGHPDAAGMLKNLGEVYRAQKRYADAGECYRRALEIWEKVIGPQNPQLIAKLEAYADVLRKLQDYAGAEQAETRALGIRVRNALHP
jgi:tetratricopeptide (TPR) repeat protein